MAFKHCVTALLLIAASLLAPATYSADYLINPGDQLRVDVWNEESLSRDVLVRPDGRISLPMAGEVGTNGKTPAQVGEAIAASLGNYMKDPPRVVVSLRKVSGNKIYVLGKVDKPGEYIITAETDVMQALALAGGLNAFAAENDIRILRRRPDGSQVSLAFEYARVKNGSDLQSNILLQSRDVVVVP